MPKSNNEGYWRNIATAVSSLSSGLKLSWKHLLEARQARDNAGIDQPAYFEQDTGMATLQYPHESFPIPDNGRHRLHNEIDDCIVCDKCAKICPVDCIDIEPVRAVEDMGKTSDGTPKRIHAAKFDIDMGKCCFCGLCTTVCPTECLTMTKAYDYSVYDIKEHNYSFAEMTPLEILEKKQALEAFNKEKEAAKAAGTTGKPAARPKPKARPKPVTPASSDNANEEARKAALDAMQRKKAEGEASKDTTGKAKPVFKPRPRPVTNQTTEDTSSSKPKKAKPVIKGKPIIKKKGESEPNNEGAPSAQEHSPPKARPVIKAKPVIKKTENEANTGPTPDAPKKARPVIKAKPVIKKAAESGANADGTPDAQANSPKKARPVIKAKPIIKKADDKAATSDAKDTAPKKARPVIKAKPVVPPKKEDSEPGIVNKKPTIKVKPVIKPVIKKRDEPGQTGKDVGESPGEDNQG